MDATIAEEPRRTPVAGAYDVVVAGGGPAGVCAAIAAARHGASVLLVEQDGCLGGVWTAGKLAWVIDAANKGGLMGEIVSALEEDGARYQPESTSSFAYDPEAMKLLLDRMAREAGVTVLLYSRVVAARVRDARLTHALTEGPSGRQAWSGRRFIDATVEGDLAALAGCGFDRGHPDTGRCQPMSLMAILTGLDPEAIRPYVNDALGRAAKDRLRAACQSAGVSPSYSAPSLFRIHDDLYALMENHLYGVSSSDALGMSAATMDARAEIAAVVAALRRSEPAWRGARVVATGERIGIREGRRIHGQATVTVADLREGAHYDDDVCEVTFAIDVHATDPATSKDYGEENAWPTRPYGIPLRALIAKDVEGLLMAGRCISGDFWAHSSYRVTGDAAAMGEAAGRFSAEAALRGKG